MADFDDRSGRDSRLLALVIVIAITVLVVLARFRYPHSDSRPVAVTPGPLERLAARGTFDDLAAAVQTALQRVEPALIPVSIEPDPQAPKPQLPIPRRLLGVRLDGEWAVVHLPPGSRIVTSSPEDVMTVRGLDPVKEFAVVSRPLSPGEDKLPTGIADLSAFAYVCVVEPTDDGPTASPVFVGRTRLVLDERWVENLHVPGGTLNAPPGSLVFQLDGRFLGMTLRRPDGGVTIVPASLLESVVASVRGRPPGGIP